MVLLDESDRILLVRFHDPDSGKTWWATPGGALEPGETHEAAARREIAEETGLRSLDLGPCIWTREQAVTILGRAYLQIERLFFARVAHFEARATQLEEVEWGRFCELRWWSLDDLVSAGVDVAPRNLAALVRQLLQDGAPVTPLAVGI